MMIRRDTASAEGHDVIGYVQRCRWRWCAATFVRSFLIALSGSLAAATVWTLTFGAVAEGGRAALAVIALTLAVAMTLTAFRRPSSRQIAEMIDRRAGLQNRVATALEVCGQADAFSLLVTADARRHLHTVEPRQVFPFALGPLVPATASAISVFAVVTSMFEPHISNSDHARRVTPLGGAVQSGAAKRATAPGDESTEQVRDGGDLLLSGATAAHKVTDRVPTAIASASTRSSEASENRGAPTPKHAYEGSTRRGAIPQDGSRRSTFGDRAPGAAGKTGEGAGSGGSAAESARAASGAASAGTGPRAAGQSDLAGGVDGDASWQVPPLVPPAAASSDRSAEATLAAARAQAEASLRQDDIPPARRNVVRRYFTELQRRVVP